MILIDKHWGKVRQIQTELRGVGHFIVHIIYLLHSFVIAILSIALPVPHPNWLRLSVALGTHQMSRALEGETVYFIAVL